MEPPLTATAEEGVRHALRRATRAAHHRIDHHPLLAPLLRADLTLEHYGRTLAALYGVQAILEARVAPLWQSPPLPPFPPPQRQVALQRDLAQLGVVPWPVVIPFPELNGAAEQIGALYVLEGSALGGQIIAHTVAQHGGSRFPTQFFTGLGAEASRQRWQAFGIYAEQRCPAAEWERATAAAQAVFGAMSDHLDRCGREMVEMLALPVKGDSPKFDSGSDSEGGGH